ncbi:MAG: hypothetical protein JEY94_02665 [Melioribacteraceae bacterium]|nr:hypothetical protein [Melioribacteraceae bacterium]
MKKLFLFFFIINISVSVAQKYEDVGWMSKFGAAIGYTPAWIVPNVDPLNKELKKLNISSIAENGLFVSGGGGYIYLMLIKDLRIGGMGYTGSTSEKTNINGVITQADYSISGGGISLEYTLPFIRRIGISVGAIFGSGSVELNLFKNDGNFDWNEIWTDYSEQSQNINDISRKISNNFYTFTPTINFDIPFTRFSAFRLGGGYQITFENDWEIENKRDLKNVPGDFNGDSYFIQAGIFVGFFAF